MSIQNIRLSPQEVEAIYTAFRRFFGPEDHLWLFGSRVNPNARGGDIDLYIETTLPDASTVVDQKIAFVGELYQKIGEQKIDVVLHLLTSDFHLPIYDIARQEGVQLV